MLVWLLPMHHTNSYAVHTQVRIVQKYIERKNHKLVLAKGAGSRSHIELFLDLAKSKKLDLIPAT